MLNNENIKEDLYVKWWGIISSEYPNVRASNSQYGIIQAQTETFIFHESPAHIRCILKRFMSLK